MDDAADVIVVGAGPSGLMAATCLARLGVRAIVIDGKAGPTRESRALALQARSIEIYDQLDLSREVLAEATLAPAIYGGVGRRAFRPVRFTEIGRTVTPYPGLHILEQSRNERILRDAFLRLGGQIRWEHTFASLRSAAAPDESIEIVADSPHGPVTLRAPWCIAADGASSPVRKHLGIDFAGQTSPLSFFVADALDATGLKQDGINLRVSGDDFMLTFPMGGRGHHRILGVIESADDAPDEEVERGVRALLEQQFGVRYTRSAWFSKYRAHHRLARSFRVGGVFLVGDAAHVHSPVGAQGMNTGLQDAHNLACKLAAVILDGASPGTLDRYEAERRPVAARLVRTTDAAFVRITARRPFARFMRTKVVPVLAPIGVRIVPRLIGGERIFGYLSQTRIRYRMPGADRRDRVVGRRLPWTGNNYSSLRRFTWQVHSYGADQSALERAASAIGAEPYAFAADQFGRLPPDRLYLVRPDGFIAAAAAPDDAAGAFERQGRAAQD